MKIRFGIVGCGFLGNIVANAWKDGFLEDYEIGGIKATVDICSSTSAIAGWSAVALLRNLASPICFY